MDMPSPVGKCSVPASVVALSSHLSPEGAGAPRSALLPFSLRTALGAHHTETSFTCRNPSCFPAQAEGSGADVEGSRPLGMEGSL